MVPPSPAPAHPTPTGEHSDITLSVTSAVEAAPSGSGPITRGRKRGRNGEGAAPEADPTPSSGDEDVPDPSKPGPSKPGGSGGGGGGGDDGGGGSGGGNAGGIGAPAAFVSCAACHTTLPWKGCPRLPTGWRRHNTHTPLEVSPTFVLCKDCHNSMQTCTRHCGLAKISCSNFLTTLLRKLSAHLGEVRLAFGIFYNVKFLFVLNFFIFAFYNIKIIPFI